MVTALLCWRCRLEHRRHSNKGPSASHAQRRRGSFGIASLRWLWHEFASVICPLCINSQFFRWRAGASPPRQQKIPPTSLLPTCTSPRPHASVMEAVVKMNAAVAPAYSTVHRLWLLLLSLVICTARGVEWSRVQSQIQSDPAIEARAHEILAGMTLQGNSISCECISFERLFLLWLTTISSSRKDWADDSSRDSKRYTRSSPTI